MKYYEAIKIVENLEMYTEDEIGCAIHKIINMTTINAVNKNTLLNIVKYLFDKCYEVVMDGGENDKKKAN